MSNNIATKILKRQESTSNECFQTEKKYISFHLKCCASLASLYYYYGWNQRLLIRFEWEAKQIVIPTICTLLKRLSFDEIVYQMSSVSNPSKRTSTWKTGKASLLVFLFEHKTHVVTLLISHPLVYYLESHT